MAQSFLQAGNISTSTGTTSTQSITGPTTTASSFLVIGIRNNSAVHNATSATYGGVSGTKLSTDTTVGNGGAGGNAFIFFGVPTGTQTLSIVNSGSDNWVGNYAFYDGFASSLDATTNYLNLNTTATPTRTLQPTSANCWVILISANADVNGTAGSGTTFRNGSTGIIGDSNGQVSNSSPYSMTATVTSTRTSFVYLIAVAPASGGGTTPNPAFLLNMI